MPINHAKEFLKYVLYFHNLFVRASNCSHYSNFGNKCPKLGTGTPEDMLFTNLGETLDSVPSGIVLVNNNLTPILPLKGAYGGAPIFSHKPHSR